MSLAALSGPGFGFVADSLAPAQCWHNQALLSLPFELNQWDKDTELENWAKTFLELCDSHGERAAQSLKKSWHPATWEKQAMDRSGGGH